MQKDYSKDIIDKYKKYQIFTHVTEENIEAFLEGKLEFAKELLFLSSLL